MTQSIFSQALSVGSYGHTGQLWFDDVALVAGVPPIELVVNGKTELKKATVSMQATGDVIYEKKFPADTFQFLATIPDACADQPYRVKVELEDGTVINKVYPSEYQKYRR